MDNALDLLRSVVIVCAVLLSAVAVGAAVGIVLIVLVKV